MFLAQNITEAIITNSIVGMVMFALLKLTLKKSDWSNNVKYNIYLFSLLGLSIYFLSSVLFSYFYPKTSLHIYVPKVSNTAFQYIQYGLSSGYILGALAILIYQCWQLLKLKNIEKIATNKTPIALKLFLEKQAVLFGITKNVRLVVSNKIDAVFTIGHLRPIIYLPLQLATGLNFTQCEALLTHELAHIKRSDYFWNIVIVISKAILFFNPVAWWLQKQLQHERELACDQWVKTFYYNPVSYAETLLFLQRLKPNLNFAIGFASDGLSLTHRIKSILNPQKAYFSKFEKSGWAMILGCIGLFFFTAPNNVIENKPTNIYSFKKKKKENEKYNLTFAKEKNEIIKNINPEKLKAPNALPQTTIWEPILRNEYEEEDIKVLNVVNNIENHQFNSVSFAESLLQQSQATYLKTNYNKTLHKINVLFEDIDNSNAKQKSVVADSIIKNEFLNNKFTASIFINNKNPIYKNFGKPIRLLPNVSSADSAFVISYNRLQLVYNQIKNTTQNVETNTKQVYYYNVKEADGLCMVKFNADATSKTITPQMYFYHLPTKKLYLLFHNNDEEGFIMVPLKNEVI